VELLPLGVPQTLPARFVDHRERALDQTLSTSALSLKELDIAAVAL
jgi:hypothetical protein